MSEAGESPRATSGVPGLDEVLHGGYLRDRMYLIDGNPGAGKTTLALQFLMAGVAQDERCLYVTLSETAAELRAGAQSHGWSLDGVDICELIATPEELDADAELTMYHPSEVELTETTRRVMETVQRVRPQRMVFDSLSEMRLLAQNSLRYRRQILALKQFFAGRKCTLLLLDDRTGEGQGRQLHSIAHGVLSLEHHSPVYGPSLRQLQVTKLRGSSYHTGLQDYVIRQGGLRVFPRLTAADHGVAFQRATASSGVERLDALLGGGIDRGTATLLIGPPGSGKSSLAVQYAAAAAARGEHAAVFTFEESAALLLARAEGLGMQVEVGRGPGQLHIRRVDPAGISPGEFAHLVREAVEQHQARVVVIDSLNGYLSAMPEERALTMQLHELLAYLNYRGVVTFLVAAQPGMLGPAARAPVDASYLADAVIALRMFEHAGQVKKAISVLKKRSGRHEESIRQIWFDADGVHLSAPLLHLRGVLAGVPVESDGPHPEGHASPGPRDEP